ncbi:unnamed protein product [Staurois parvus]|uniref:Uncharacterized protein n=1 Tax=Staurois parvus TaxID=386267 RepID=A0ABN9DQ14_9NEOB|nr:unnamed protein product [Staurois parvus]
MEKRMTPSPKLSCHYSPCSLGIWGAPHDYLSLVNPKLISIACCPITGLLHCDPISGTLAGEKLFECKVARKINEGLISADVLLGSIDICKFLVKVICEGLNFVQPVKFRVTPRTTKCIFVEMHKTHYTLTSMPGHGSEEHGHMMNQVCGPIQPQLIFFSNAHVES